MRRRCPNVSLGCSLRRSLSVFPREIHGCSVFWKFIMRRRRPDVSLGHYLQSGRSRQRAGGLASGYATEWLHPWGPLLPIQDLTPCPIQKLDESHGVGIGPVVLVVSGRVPKTAESLAALPDRADHRRPAQPRPRQKSRKLTATGVLWTEPEPPPCCCRNTAGLTA